MISSVVTALLFAAILTAVGIWGRRNADKLVLSSLSASARRAKERSIRRGAIACLIGAVVFAGLACTELVLWLTHG